MKRLVIAALLFFCSTWSATGQIKIDKEIKVKVNRLAKVEAISETAVKWINLHDDLDLIPDSSGKSATVQAVKAGRYRIATYTASKTGVPSEPFYCDIIAEGPLYPPPPRPAPPPLIPTVEASIVKLRFGNSGCTATIVGPRRADGRWDVLTAAHCTAGVGSKGNITLQDGKVIPVTVAVRNTTADITWMIADGNHESLPFAMLANTVPPTGTEIWHKGFGVDVPGNLETGFVSSGVDGNGQLRMTLSVSSGDSGSGIFRKDTNEIVSVVCCTSSMAKKGSMWGGACTIAAKIRPTNVYDYPIFDDVVPVSIPQVEYEDRIMPLIVYREGSRP